MRRVTLVLPATILVTVALGANLVSASVPSASARLCRALTRIGELDAEFKEYLGTVDIVADWREVAIEYQKLGSDIEHAWNRVERRLPRKLRDDARTIADYTDSTIELAADSATADEWLAAIEAEPDAVAAGLASIRLDEYSREHCEVSINNR